MDLVLAEDTRTSRVLFQHYGIETPLKSHHIHNEHKTASAIINQLQSGMTIALITDSGTPAISDPGFYLVRAAVDAGVSVECLPGATAIIPALVVSGLPCDRFCFEGFLPHKKGRKKRLEMLLSENRTAVLYESPHRILKLLGELEAILPNRKIAVCREMTKMHEEVVRGTASELKIHFEEEKIRGEFVVVIG